MLKNSCGTCTFFRGFGPVTQVSTGYDGVCAHITNRLGRLGIMPKKYLGDSCDNFLIKVNDDTAKRD